MSVGSNSQLIASESFLLSVTSDGAMGRNCVTAVRELATLCRTVHSHISHLLRIHSVRQILSTSIISGSTKRIFFVQQTKIIRRGEACKTSTI